MAALRAFSTSNAQASRIAKQVATGQKVSSPTDDGATYAIAQNTRGQIASNDALVTAQGHMSSLIDTGMTGLQSISDLLIQMKKLATDASDTSLDSASRSALDTQFQDLKSQIDSVASNASFMGKNLIADPTTNALKMGTSWVPGGTPTATWSGGSGEPQAGEQVTVNCGVINTSGANLLLSGQASAYLTYHYANGGVGRTTIGSPTAINLTPATDGTPSVLSASGVMPTIPADVTAAELGIVFTATVDDPSQDAGLTPSDKAFLNLQNNLYDYAALQWTIGGNSPTARHLSNNTPLQQSLTVMTGSDGSMSGLATVDVSSDTLLPSNVTINSATGASDSLDAVNRAQSNVERYLQYYGDKSKMLETLQKNENAQTDVLQSSLGRMTDADMATTAAQLNAVETKQQLAMQALAIANNAPSLVLSLFHTA